MLGRFNKTVLKANPASIEDNDRMFVIGNGVQDANRSDAFVVKRNGNTAVNGTLTVGTTGTAINSIIKKLTL